MVKGRRAECTVTLPEHHAHNNTVKNQVDVSISVHISGRKSCRSVHASRNLNGGAEGSIACAEEDCYRVDAGGSIKERDVRFSIVIEVSDGEGGHIQAAA